MGAMRSSATNPSLNAGPVSQIFEKRRYTTDTDTYLPSLLHARGVFGNVRGGKRGEENTGTTAHACMGARLLVPLAPSVVAIVHRAARQDLTLPTRNLEMTPPPAIFLPTTMLQEPARTRVPMPLILHCHRPILIRTVIESIRIPDTAGHSNPPTPMSPSGRQQHDEGRVPEDY